MKGSLTFCVDDQPRRFQLSKAPTVLGSGDSCKLQFLGLNMQARHCEFSWDGHEVAWALRSLTPQADADIQVNGTRISGVRYLQDGDIIELPDMILRFGQSPDPPIFREEEISEVSLDGIETLVFGRHIEDAKPEPNKVYLDGDDTGISRRHLLLERKNSDFHITDKSRAGSFFNGSPFNTRKLIIGDRFRIGDYNFEFTGRSIRRVANIVGGKIEGRHLTLEIKDSRRILDDVSIEVEPCSFVGILGGSGQGKTTLMNALCGINPATSGEVWINEIELTDADDIRRIGIGYVPQDDIVHRELTVEQAITYSALLRMDPRTPRQAIHDLVDETIERLGLTVHRKKMISNLSGGQRKRVSIAAELLGKPAVLLLDEPSSGLDPATEFDLMKLLRLLARDCTVICTTHVLGRAYLFDEICFIQEGLIVYKGPPDKGERSSELDALKFFEVEGLEEVYPKLDNPEIPGKQWREKFEEARSGEAEAPGVPFKEPSTLERSSHGSGPFKSFEVLVRRQWSVLVADRLNLLFLLAQAIVIGALVGWVSGNLVFQMFLAVIATLWFGCSNGAQQIVAEMAIFRRERLAGLGINAYMLSKFAFLTAITGVQAILLYLTILGTNHLFHPEKLPTEPDTWRGDPELRLQVFRENFFLNQPDLLNGGGEVGIPDTPEETVKAAEPDFEEGFFMVAEKDKEYFAEIEKVETKIHYRNPTGLRGDDAQFRLLDRAAGFFRVRGNFLDQLGVQKIELKPDEEFDPGPKKSWFGLLLLLLGLRAIAMLAAAMVGVSLGLAVSALVRSPTQAVMWVPLILIPQILFGSFVITKAEMKTPVWMFSSALPSYNVQGLMDVANLYGLKTPRMSNRTKIPAFFEPPPLDKEAVRFEIENKKQEEKYDKLSAMNKSWQNQLVDRSHVGERFKKPGDESVNRREDVLFEKGTSFLLLAGAWNSLGKLAMWVLGCYAVIFLAMVKRQTGK